MSQKTKIQLLPFEIELLSNADFILTKNAILQKIKLFLDQVQLNQQVILEKKLKYLPEEVFKISPKISRGENYKGLPWLVLDHPRYFEKENVFSIRTMFWWGNFFSVTLHLSGRYKKMFEEKILEKIRQSDCSNIFLSVGDKEWEHHFETTNYQEIASITDNKFNSIMKEKIYLKLAIKSPIAAIPETEKTLGQHYEMLIGLCL